ncbi:MAG TPA: peptidoglycan DD-metalloendopeptidase family protein [Thermoanaerobaculia bacterium]|jgi:septal ring factor EnvC (AmiA/AmiB activator)|nr:peptidoglycan DD-metalloendopeptidase family protein [Thermoanaerobaculia bacterium]
MRSRTRSAASAASAAAVTILLGLALLFPLLQEPAGGASSAAANPAITAREQELASLRAEIARLQARLEQESQRRTSLEDELAAADTELQLQEARLAEAAAAHDLSARRAEAGERQVARLEQDVTAARLAMNGRLAALYRLGRQGYLRLVLALDPQRPLLPSLRLMRYLARRDRETFDRYRGVRDLLGKERDRLVAERGESERWIERESARRRELFAMRERKAALLARMEKEGQALEARATELTERASKLSELLDLLYGRYGRDQASLEGTPIQRFRGVLDWPAEGKVTAGFGPRLDPRYHTRVPHNGVDLGTAPAAEVRAVFPGKVVYAAPFEGYGNTVVVHHPGRVFTLYAGLTDLKKSAGDMVSLGDVVGLASSSLYFEIRVENRPDDPLSWLRGSP